MDSFLIVVLLLRFAWLDVVRRPSCLQKNYHHEAFRRVDGRYVDGLLDHQNVVIASDVVLTDVLELVLEPLRELGQKDPLLALLVLQFLHHLCEPLGEQVLV